MKKVFETEVFYTKDYDEFRFIKSNRSINDHKVKRLMDSMNKNPLCVPVILNERSEIIDGQHRFMAFKRLGLPVPFIIRRGYGEKEMIEMNLNGSNWNTLQFVEHYAEGGNPNYIFVLDCLSAYNKDGLTFHELKYIVTNCSGTETADKILKSGNLRIGDKSKKIKQINRLLPFIKKCEK